MGRKSSPLYRDPSTGLYYARYYSGNKRVLLSLDTCDQAEAMQRYPIVMRLNMNWREYIKTLPPVGPGPGNMSVLGLEKSALNPPLQMPYNQDAANFILQEAIRRGLATYNEDTKTWSMPMKLPKGADALPALRDILGADPAKKQDQMDAIREFYLTSVPVMFVDKVTAVRNAKIWIKFLEERKILSWSEITDTLIQDFKLWRQATAVTTEEHPDRQAKPPSGVVVTRHLKYLKKSFDLAVYRRLLRFNPLLLTKFEKYEKKKQQYLTLDELKELLKDTAWDQNYLTRGDTRFALPYSFRDVVLLLTVSCKRRKEIVFLRIEDIDFRNHFALYVEWKNKSKPDSPVKAFWLTPQMEAQLQRIIGDRKSGYVFCSPWGEDQPLNPDLISYMFDSVAKKVEPHKHVTLKNLRQSIYAICEATKKMTISEIDILLGHYSVKTALPFYQDMSREAQGIRLSEMTRKGVQLLCKTLKEFYESLKKKS